MLNHIALMGRLTREPELQRTAANVAYVRFTLACDRDYLDVNGERGTDFIDCIAWRAAAEFLCKYFHKGHMAVAVGRLQVSNWKDADGYKRRSTEVNAETIYFGEGRRKDSPPQEEPLPSAEACEAVFDAADPYVQAVEIALERGIVSTSLLQRQLKLNFADAAGLLDRMASDGIVEVTRNGPAKAVISREQWIAMRSGAGRQPDADGALPLDDAELAAIFGPVDGDG